jgi:hypothetical protein
MDVQTHLPFEPQVRLCNRCNADLTTTGAPCPGCRCPEYRLIGPAPEAPTPRRRTRPRGESRHPSTDG